MVILNHYHVCFHVVEVTSLGFDFLLKVSHNILCLATYKCQKCTEEFTCLLKLAVHLNGEHERINNRSQCPICPKNYHKNFTKVTNHIKSVHLNVKKKCKICQDIVPFRWFSVEICKLGYKSHDLLKIEYSHWLKSQHSDCRAN